MPPHLCFFLQRERKSSVGLFVPASSCGLLRAMGQTRLRGLGQTKQFPRGQRGSWEHRVSSRFHQPRCRREGEGRMEQREQCTHGRELVHCSFPASHPSLTFPVGGIEAVLTFYCTCRSASVRSKTMSHCFLERKSNPGPFIWHCKINLGLNQCKDIQDADMTPHAQGFMTRSGLDVKGVEDGQLTLDCSQHCFETLVQHSW